MPTKIFWLHSSPHLGIMARPRGQEWLEEEIIHIKKQNVQIMISLLERDEIYELGLQQQAELCAKHHIEYLNFPIKDRSIPSKNKEAQHFINVLIDKMKAGSNIVIHCRMGIGRSSIMAGKLLLHLGYKANELIAHISKARGLSVPDTDAQAAWLLSSTR